MKINMTELNPGRWFYFEEDKPEDGRILLRVLTTGKLAEIRNKTVKTNVEYKRNQRFEYQTINKDLRDEIIWDYCIMDWENLNDDNDTPIECSKENKLMLMNNQPNFSAFVEVCLRVLNAEMEMLSEYREKN